MDGFVYFGSDCNCSEKKTGEMMQKQRRYCFWVITTPKNIQRRYCPSTIKSKTHSCCHGTKAQSDLFTSWYALIQFNLELIESCVLETCGQITKENEITLDLIELYRGNEETYRGISPQSIVQMETGDQQGHGPQTRLTRIKSGRLETVCTCENTEPVHLKRTLEWAVYWNQCTS